MKLIRLFTILLFAVSFASAQTESSRPKMIAPQLCGMVTNLSGMPIAKVRVSAMVADFGSSVFSNESGQWSFAGNAGSRWIMVTAEGFETAIFDYAPSSKKQKNVRDQPAFVKGADAKDLCKTPIFIRLALKDNKSGFVTLDPIKGLQKESDSH